ncbi:glycosyltransferase family 4 protein [Methylolobus aquaticus]
MKVCIATTGRFHVLDLARELDRLGYEVSFWSIVPRRRAERFGLPRGCHRGLLWRFWPLVLAQRFGTQALRRAAGDRLMQSVDRQIASRLERCDVFIGMSGIAIESARSARERYGATIFIERGSRHILSQKEILDGIAKVFPQAETVSEHAVRIHMASCEIADFHVVPARHCEKSFLELGYKPEQLFLNPYGVDLTMFRPTVVPRAEPPVLVFAGTWCYRKGAEILARAVGEINAGRVRLIHVGPLGDAPLPAGDWFEHHDAVPQWKLPEFYAKAHAFVLASREEGLALVQVQALACGLPVVCTDRTGGEDLAEVTDLQDGIFVVPHGDVEALAEGIERCLEWAQAHFPPGTLRDLLGEKRKELSWQAYGERYAEKIRETVSR